MADLSGMTRFFHALQPPKDQFNLTHLLVTFLSLIVAQDLENDARQEDSTTGKPMEYFKLLEASGPSALYGIFSAVCLLIPWLHKFACIPLVTNLCVRFELGKNNYIGSAISIGYNLIHLSNGYGMKTAAIVNCVSFCLAPHTVSLFKLCSPSSSLVERTWLISFVQLLLCASTMKYKPFFEDIAIRCFFKRFTATQLQSSPWKFIMAAFEVKDDYLNDLLVRSVVEYPLHRRTSQTPRPLLIVGDNIEINSIGKMISDIFCSSTSVKTVEVVKQTVTPNARGVDVSTLGSPCHQLVRYVTGLGDNISLNMHRERIDRRFGTDTLKKSLRLQYLQLRGSDNNRRINIGPVIPPENDNLQELMRRLLDGSGQTTLREIQARGAMEFVEYELDLKGEFVKKYEKHPPATFELKVKK